MIPHICVLFLHTFSLCDFCHLGIAQPCIAMHTGVRKISVHSVNLCQVMASADRTDIHLKFLIYKEADGHLYAIYGTPAENLCGLQVKQFRAKYGWLPQTGQTSISSS